MAVDAFLMAILIVAVIYDLKTRRIPNWLLAAALAIALLYHLHGEGYKGLFFSIQGLLAGILLLIIPFTAGGIGAGDVKLLGVVGALKGSTFAMTSFLGMALWGGLIAIIVLLTRRQLKATLLRMGRGLLLLPLTGLQMNNLITKSEFHISYPYALAIMLGVISSYSKVW